MTHPNPFEGTDHSWLAQDRVGHVGWFTVNADGPVPRALHDADLGAHEELLAAWLQARGLPFRPGPDPEKSMWHDAAAAGIFGYDGSRETLDYALEVRPARPLHHADLPDELRAISFVRLDVEFATTDTIEAAAITDL